MTERTFQPRKHFRFAIFLCRDAKAYEYISCHWSLKRAMKKAVVLAERSNDPIHIVEMHGRYPTEETLR